MCLLTQLFPSAHFRYHFCTFGCKSSLSLLVTIYSSLLTNPSLLLPPFQQSSTESRAVTLQRTSTEIEGLISFNSSPLDRVLCQKGWAGLCIKHHSGIIIFMLLPTSNFHINSLPWPVLLLCSISSNHRNASQVSSVTVSRW